jgi:hypothetical protein
LRITNVAGLRQDSNPATGQFPARSLQHRQIAAAKNDIALLRRERSGNGEADASARARDKGDLAGKR